MRSQSGVAKVGDAEADLLDIQVVGQVPGADDLHAIRKNQQANRGAHKIIAMHQGIDQQLFEGILGHLQQTGTVEALITPFGVNAGRQGLPTKKPDGQRPSGLYSNDSART